MAQKALKTLASRNTTTLNRTHWIALSVNLFYLLARTFISTRRRSLLAYMLCNAPAVAIEFWLERIGRPKVVDGEVKRAGEDLSAEGLTEWMWDVMYWTWGTIAAVALGGDRAWWLYAVVPVYSVWLAWRAYRGIRGGLGGLMGGGGGAGGQGQRGDAAGAGSGQSKRQAKMDKRGGQRVQAR